MPLIDRAPNSVFVVLAKLASSRAARERDAKQRERALERWTADNIDRLPNDVAEAWLDEQEDKLDELEAEAEEMEADEQKAAERERRQKQLRRRAPAESAISPDAHGMHSVKSITRGHAACLCEGSNRGDYAVHGHSHCCPDWRLCRGCRGY
jgi:hypothetical protein